MDPVTIGMSVVALLTPYVKDAGTELVKTAGEAGLEKIKSLLQWLKGRFAGDPVATADLSRFEKDPAAYAPALQATIDTRAQQDPAFASEIGQRVKDLGPIITIVQTFDDGTGITGIQADRVARGKISVTQDFKTGKDVNGAVFGTIE